MKTRVFIAGGLCLVVATIAVNFRSKSEGHDLFAPRHDSIITRAGRSIGSKELEQFGEQVQRQQWRRFLKNAARRGEIACIKPRWEHLPHEERQIALLHLAESTGGEFLHVELETEVLIFARTEDEAAIVAALATS